MPEKKEESEYTGNYTNKEYREKHKEYIMQKIKCPCGTVITYCNRSHHNKTPRHIEKMANIVIVTEEVSDAKSVKKLIKENIELLRNISKMEDVAEQAKKLNQIKKDLNLILV